MRERNKQQLTYYYGHHVPRRYIVVAGDGSQGAYILSPDSEQPDDWSYTLQEVRKVTREGRGRQSESERAKRGMAPHMR